jgi:hypothetical protein
MNEYDNQPPPHAGLTPLGERYATPSEAGSSQAWPPPTPRAWVDDPVPPEPKRPFRPWRALAIGLGVLALAAFSYLVLGIGKGPVYTAKVVSVVPQEPNSGVQPDGSTTIDFGYTYTLTYSITNHSKDLTVNPECTEYLDMGSTHFMANMNGAQTGPIGPGETVEFTVDISPPSFGGGAVTSAADAPAYKGGVDCKG